jgi:hypothetical protein
LPWTNSARQPAKPGEKLASTTSGEIQIFTRGAMVARYGNESRDGSHESAMQVADILLGFK